MLENDSYLQAHLAALARRHRPQWSWARLRMVCRCGADLPCRTRAVPRRHDPGHRSS